MTSKSPLESGWRRQVVDEARRKPPPFMRFFFSLLIWYHKRLIACSGGIFPKRTLYSTHSWKKYDDGRTPLCYHSETNYTFDSPLILFWQLPPFQTTHPSPLPWTVIDTHTHSVKRLIFLICLLSRRCCTSPATLQSDVWLPLMLLPFLSLI